MALKKAQTDHFQVKAAIREIAACVDQVRHRCLYRPCGGLQTLWLVFGWLCSFFGVFVVVFRWFLVV